jgi:hypothetical protein
VTVERAPLAVRLLERCLPDNEPLAGDLLEAAPDRSPIWLWRQVVGAVAGGLVLRIRSRPRESTETALVALAMLTLLGFHAVVVATLMNHVLVLHSTPAVPLTGRYEAWQSAAMVPGFVLAVGIGRAIARVHRHGRIAAVLAFGASASAAAFLNLYLFVPDVLLRPFVPYAAVQTAVTMVFIAGLFAGSSSRPPCEPLQSS